MSPFKIAISGKGGVGKTTIASTMARLYGREGKNVVLVDCDPAPNLALSLGIPAEERKNIVPLCQLSKLIAERTGVKPGESQGKMYTINPEVDDLLEIYGVKGKDNVTLLVLGTIRTGGGGCFCPESALLKRLLGHLVRKEEILFMDMEAGVEHLGRGTTRNIDLLLVIVEPGQRSLETASTIKKLGEDLGIRHVLAILNKCRDEAQKREIRKRLKEMDIDLIGVLPYSEEVMRTDLEGTSIMDQGENDSFTREIERVMKVMSEQMYG